MTIALTIVAFLVLVTGGAYVIHRLNTAHDERIASHSYSRLLPGRAAGTTAPHPAPTAAHGRREGGGGRPRWRRHRDRTTHKGPTGAQG